MKTTITETFLEKRLSDGRADDGLVTISAAFKVEHYEIASSGCRLERAESLGNEKAADLRKTVKEEKMADGSLAAPALSSWSGHALGNVEACEAAPTEEGEQWKTHLEESSKRPALACGR